MTAAFRCRNDEAGHIVANEICSDFEVLFEYVRRR